MAVKLENEFLCVEIAEMGAEVTRIYDKTEDNEILWEGNPVYWKRHSPVLFPNVGKTYKNRVLINGTQYPTSQHGFARDNVFTCIEAANEKASFMFRSSEETKEVYPFDFELHINYKLNKKELTVEWQVKNCGDETMYFTIGGHPAFRFAKPEETKADYVLKVPGKEKLEYVLIDISCGCANVDEVHTLQLSEETYPLSDKLFAKDALVVDNGQIEEAWLCHKDGTPYVGVRSAGFPNYGIWSVEGAPFVCLEPWMGRCDNVGFNAELSEKPNVNKVEAGEKFIKDYTIVVA
ncbi:aldose 1-epimerase family protein [Mediterraneibacter sp. NSJ-151]|uniref:aldose 1-epimerase family protein n=1 Tax=Mediterraneibacter sp. NSJ-151 TaxID=2897708 RepID=UPI001F0B2297|nr:aldose 1-epimerase family protein [Mediterraneibacter sp. NSJ-151]MCH4278746.1 aldose 1-epimerase family protein [Mediterraneibacter sp. NSJ-151]